LTLVETTLGSLYAAGARDVSVWYMNEVQDRQAANTISMRLRSRWHFQSSARGGLVHDL